MRLRLRFSLIAVAIVGFLIAASHRRAVTPAPRPLDIHRSFAVTDQAILDGFSFERVMTALVERSATRSGTPTSLFQQWFDTQNAKPGLTSSNAAPHCDDFLTAGKPSFNGFSRRCPTPEGSLAREDPFVPAQFIPLALINRFDLTAADGSNCGQYRLIFARTVGGTPIIGATPVDRVNAIFEAVLPNPDPSKGLAGCRPVAKFWAELSQLDSMAERRAHLEAFFFTGIPGFAPVVHPDHYSRSSGGGIRTFHWTVQANVPPRFYQFRLEKACAGNGCTLVMQPDVLENLPPGRLFNGLEASEQARRFRDEFIRHVETLAIRDQNRFFMNVPREFLIGESSTPEDPIPYIASLPFVTGLLTAEGRAFNDRIDAELRRINSSLKSIDIVMRAETLNCTGCHFRAGIPFLEHLSQARRETGEAGPRFAISPAMRDVFMPHRMQILRTFLASGTFPNYYEVDGVAHSGGTIGGGRGVQ